MGELSHRDRLLAELELMRERVAELEQELRLLDNPQPQHRKPKLQLIRGGLAAFLGPFAMAGNQVRDHVAASAAAAVTVAGVGAGGALLVAESPAPAGAVSPAESVQQDVSDVQAPAPPGWSGWVAPPRSSPRGQAGPPTPTPNPTSTVTTTPTPILLLVDEAVMVEPTSTPVLLATPESTPTLTPKPTPLPSPSPSPTVWTQVDAVQFCLDTLGIPPVGLPACMANLVD